MMILNSEWEKMTPPTPIDVLHAVRRYKKNKRDESKDKTIELKNKKYLSLEERLWIDEEVPRRKSLLNHNRLKEFFMKGLAFEADEFIRETNYMPNDRWEREILSSRPRINATYRGLKKGLGLFCQETGRYRAPSFDQEVTLTFINMIEGRSAQRQQWIRDNIPHDWRKEKELNAKRKKEQESNPNSN